MRKGKKAFEIPRKARIIYLPTDLSAEIDLLLCDPLRGKIQYGAFTTLAENLFRQWVDAQRMQPEQIG